VVSSAQRNRIEQEYEAYKADLRRTMPVGRTLDNLVAQASTRLGSVDPNLARLMQDNAALREPLAAVQATMDKAREQLELAQRESARSLAQDAARNGVNLSVYLSRLERLATTLSTAQELATISSRYQEQVDVVEKSMRELEAAAAEQMQGYRDKIAALGEYAPGHIDYAFTELGAKGPSSRELAVMELLQTHVGDFSDKRRADLHAWNDAFRERFKGFVDN